MVETCDCRPRSWLRVAVLAAVAWVVCGCGLERPSADGLGVEGDTGVDASDPEAGAEAGSVEFGTGSGTGDLEGTWLLVHRRSNCIFGAEQISRSIYRVRIDQQGESLHERRALCDTDIGSIAGATVDVPRRVAESVSFPVVDRGLISQVRPGSQYVSSTEVALWGLDLSSPQTAELPSEADSEAVVDADGDGKPGVTFIINGGSCRRFAGQRHLIRYVGRLETATLIRGRSTSSTELQVYGATNSFCADAPELVANDAASEFAMARVDGRGGAPDADADGDETITCEEIRSLPHGELLGLREPDPDRCDF